MHIQARHVIACLIIGANAVLPAHVLAATKPEPTAAEPRMVKIKQPHCIRMYDVVAKRLKGRGSETVSTATRNGLKDFFVTRPGVIDCTGQRDIPWSDSKDRELIVALVKETNDAFKSKVDMTKNYGVGPAAAPIAPR